LQARLGLMMPVIILGGIYGGVFTPTEASAVAVFYALIVGTVIYREIKPHGPVPHPAQIGDLVGGDHVHHCQRRAVCVPDHACRRA
jgi:TRAP-type C4-dicarboxylate transport system permease large subunit